MRILIAFAMLTLATLSVASDDEFKSLYIKFELAFNSHDADKVSKWLAKDYELLETTSFPGYGLVGGEKSSRKKLLSYIRNQIRRGSYPLSEFSGVKINLVNDKEFCGHSSVLIPNQHMGRNKDNEITQTQERKVCFRLEGGKYVVYKHTIETYMMDKAALIHSISDDIQALSQFSQEAGQAGNRLVKKGEKILPKAHKALLNKSSNLKLIMQLITVLGQIGDPRSIGPIIKVAKMHPDNPFIYQNALRSFAFMTPTRETDAFAEDQLINDRPRIMQRMALYYFAMHKDRSARKWVEKFAISDTRPDLRDAALMLAAALNDQRAKPVIVEMLHHTRHSTKEYNLLMALSDLVKPDEFSRLTENIDHNLNQYHQVMVHNKFIWGTSKEKSSLVQAMLRSSSPNDWRLVVKYLLNNTDREILKPYIKYDANPGMGALVRNEAKQNHYRIVKKGNDVIFQRIKAN